MSSIKRPARVSAIAGLAGLVLVLGYSADLLTKQWVVKSMHVGETRWIIRPWLRLYSVRNPGAAFSMGEGFTWVFALFMAVVAVVVIAALFRCRSLWWATALSALLAGTLGNLTDRLMRQPSFGHGHVVDFISVGRFAVFNVADALITCSVALMVVLMWINVHFRGNQPGGQSGPHRKNRAAETEAA